MASKQRRVFIQQEASIPTLWVEGNAEQVKPIIDCYGGVDEMLRQAACAAVLGMNFRLDFYVAPISDTQEQEEAHLVVWRRIQSDALIGGRKPTEKEA